MSGQTADATPTAPTAPVAMKRKSRRVDGCSKLALSATAFPQIFYGLFALVFSVARLCTRSNASFRHLTQNQMESPHVV
jgi:hypothetical protein